eukprot:SAG11_NODE_2050_length_3882_cov_13.229842_7_plen_172_part_00
MGSADRQTHGPVTERVLISALQHLSRPGSVSAVLSVVGSLPDRAAFSKDLSGATRPRGHVTRFRGSSFLHMCTGRRRSPICQVCQVYHRVQLVRCSANLCDSQHTLLRSLRMKVACKERPRTIWPTRRRYKSLSCSEMTGSYSSTSASKPGGASVVCANYNVRGLKLVQPE